MRTSGLSRRLRRRVVDAFEVPVTLLNLDPDEAEMFVELTFAGGFTFVALVERILSLKGEDPLRAMSILLDGLRKTAEIVYGREVVQGFDGVLDTLQRHGRTV